MKRVVTLALTLAASGAVLAQPAPIVGSWLCETELNNRGNTFVIERRETYNASGEHLSVARSYAFPAGEPEQRIMDLQVTTVGSWELNDGMLTTSINEANVVDLVNPDSREASSLSEFLLAQDPDSVGITVTENRLVLSYPASGQSLECSPAANGS
ncbi:hypothetical protein [Salinibius halmophilus]|uniref:hypothetical protein n=1 Tax=Salinibius halmophilus TaxID=1853216 RepID=UPI000E6635DC|nr:hypothetical protein [Salinibius halmophilus]